MPTRAGGCCGLFRSTAARLSPASAVLNFRNSSSPGGECRRRIEGVQRRRLVEDAEGVAEESRAPKAEGDGGPGRPQSGSWHPGPPPERGRRHRGPLPGARVRGSAPQAPQLQPPEKRGGLHPGGRRRAARIAFRDGMEQVTRFRPLPDFEVYPGPFQHQPRIGRDRKAHLRRPERGLGRPGNGPSGEGFRPGPGGSGRSCGTAPRPPGRAVPLPGSGHAEAPPQPRPGRPAKAPNRAVPGGRREAPSGDPGETEPPVMSRAGPLPAAGEAGGAATCRRSGNAASARAALAGDPGGKARRPGPSPGGAAVPKRAGPGAVRRMGSPRPRHRRRPHRAGAIIGTAPGAGRFPR